MRRILSVFAQPVRDRLALLVLARENFRPPYSGRNARPHGADAEVIAFLVFPDHHFQWMARLCTCFFQRSGDLDGSHAADVAVKVSAFDHRVDVRSEQQHGQFFRAVAVPEQITGRVRPHLQPGILHQSAHIFPCRQLGVRIAQASNPAFWILSKFAQLLERTPATAAS